MTCSFGLMNRKADPRYGDPWSFRGRVDFSIFDNVNPLWCWLLQLNHRVQGEHLTSQPSWVTTWPLVTRACPVCLVGEGCYYGATYLLLGGRWGKKGGRVVSWEGGKVYDWSEVVRQERCVSGVRWQVGKGRKIIKWCGGRGGNIIKR